MRVLLILMLVFVTGCTHSKYHDMVLSSYQPHEPTNFYAEECMPDDVRRVVLLPIFNPDLSEPMLAQLEEVFYSELAKRNYFEMVPVSRSQLYDAHGLSQINTIDPLPFAFYQKLEHDFDADAVLFVDLTHYQAYQPILVGVRFRLVHLSSGRTIWAFDSAFDSGNLNVIAGVRDFRYHSLSMQYPLHDSDAIFRSPIKFSKYVAYEVFRTVPVRK